MKPIFDDLLSVQGVKGVFLISHEGEVSFNKLTAPLPREVDFYRALNLLPKTLAEMREADLVFSGLRIYIRRAETGFIVVLLESYAPVAMIRLNCDILLPALKPAKRATGLSRFFKRQG